MAPYELYGFTLLQPLWLLPAVALLLAARVFRQAPAADDWQRILSAPVRRYLLGSQSPRRSVNRSLLAAAVVCAALGSPATRQTSADAWQHATGWFAIVDLSRSMTLEDTRPSRLAAARHALDTLMHASGSRPLTLILYAGDAFLAAAPAIDKRLFSEQAALLEHGLIEQAGSRPTRALALAMAVARDSGVSRARFFLLTDSGGIGTATEQVARQMAAAGHRLDVVLFGQLTRGRGAVDPASAARLATAGDGQLVHTDSLGHFTADTLDAGQRLEPAERALLQPLVWKSQAHWLLLVLLPLLLNRFRWVRP